MCHCCFCQEVFTVALSHLYNYVSVYVIRLLANLDYTLVLHTQYNREGLIKYQKAPVAHIHLIDYSDCVDVLDNFAQIGTVHC